MRVLLFKYFDMLVNCTLKLFLSFPSNQQPYSGKARDKYNACILYMFLDIA